MCVYQVSLKEVIHCGDEPLANEDFPVMETNGRVGAVYGTVLSSQPSILRQYSIVYTCRTASQINKDRHENTFLVYVHHLHRL